MAENGLNSRRALWAAQYQSAPRKRLVAATQTIESGPATDITALCPTKADCGDAPSFDMVVTAPIGTLEGGFFGVGVSGDALSVPTQAQYPYLAEEETECIRVRGLFPRAAAADTVLDTPMVTAAGVAVPNKVFLLNGVDQTEVICQIVFEIPILNWV